MKSLSIAFVTLLWISGCSVLQPQPNRTRYFLLEPTAALLAADSNIGDRQGFSVGIGPVRLPDYLRRAEVVRRSGDNQMRFDDDERWAESLDHSFARVLTQDVANLLSPAAVFRLPAPLNTRLTLEVPLEVLRFESAHDGLVHLQARWVLRAPHDDKLLTGHDSQITEPITGTDTAAVVAAMSRAVATLALEITTAVRNYEIEKPSQQRK